MGHTERGDVVIVDTLAAVAFQAAQRVVDLAAQAIAARGRFTLALSGGSTPQALYTLLAAPPWYDQIAWEFVHVFWGDERFVAPDDPESSYRIAREALLTRVPIPDVQVHPFRTVGLTLEESATAYAATLAGDGQGQTPRLDLVLLGMGPDGHTASLFPGHPEPAAPGETLVVAVHHAPKPPPLRLSCTYRLFNHAAHVLFLVAGADKAATLRDVLQGPERRALLPAQGIRPLNGTLTWLVDRAAASALVSHEKKGNG